MKGKLIPYACILPLPITNKELNIKSHNFRINIQMYQK